MEIKRIQLRGISRTPSDRMTEDGGVAESLNVYIDSNEIAPAFTPKDVTSSIVGSTLDSDTEVIFLHKVAQKEICILSKYSDEGVTLQWKDPVLNLSGSIYVMALDEEIKDVVAVGNTLIVSTSKCIHYALYKDNGYLYLGTKIPFPTIEFFDAEVKAKKVTQIKGDNFGIDIVYAYEPDIFDDEEGATIVDGIIIHHETSAYDDIYALTHFKKEYWDDVDVDGYFKKEMATNTFNAVKTKWMQMIRTNAENGVFSNSFWAIYAVSLYDGALIISVPQLLSPGDVEPIEICGRGRWLGFDELYQGTNSFLIRLTKCFKLGIRMHDFPSTEAEQWKDIIKKIEVYISEDISDIDFTSMTPIGDVVHPDADTYYTKFFLRKRNDESFIDSALSKSSFVKVEEFIFNHSASEEDKSVDLLRSDYICDAKKYVLNEDRFSGKDLLSSKIYDIKQSLYTTEKNLIFNNKLYLLGCEEHLSSGTRWMNSQRFSVFLPRPLFADLPLLSEYPQGWFKNPWRSGEDILLNGGLFNPQEITVTISYDIQDTSGQAAILGRTAQNNFDFVTIYDRYELNKPEIGSLLIYPNPNCRHAYIEIVDGSTTYQRRVDMKPHPYLPMCSYWYESGALYESVRGFHDFSALPIEQPIISANNKMIVTSLNNPFVFPTASAITFDSTIVGAAVATSALSQGQFGQFPLYVFTEEGVFAMESSPSGDIMAHKPLSRDVCVNANSIKSIDDAVVFVTSNGAKLLRGAQVIDISPYMNGRHYVIESTAETIIEKQDFFCDLLPAISDSTHFLAFIKQASVSFDYTGNRLIFIKEGEKYQYVYKIDTQTWHKVAYAINLKSPLNSYPECLVSGNDESGNHVYNLSTTLDAAESQIPTKGIIATRPFDLDEPDVYKTIRDIRVRGQFPKGAVKFILLGSNDGIHFSVINTLRGKSWKLFRLIILADLDATDRISWIDIGYETRFTNKLR